MDTIINHTADTPIADSAPEITVTEETCSPAETEVNVITVGTDSTAEQPESTPDQEDADPLIPPLPLPDPISDFRGCISAFGFSQQGQSHIKKDMPCQDRSSFRFLSDCVIIAAVADGVGSCALSDYGAATAVQASLDYLQQHIGPKLEDPAFHIDVPFMGKVLREMMQYAYDQVQAKADELEQFLYSLQSTLTVAVYDGQTLYFAHAGDDGIVALTQDGKCEMATSRHKGEEASSVYPLQSCNTWQYGKADNVSGFVLATDGVLDAFVRSENEGNRVYYPFIEPAFSTALTGKEDTADACKDWYTYMQSDAYRASVTDDLSFICIINQQAMKTGKKPDFDMELWNQKTREYDRRRKAALYPPKAEYMPPPADTPKQPPHSPESRRFHPQVKKMHHPSNRRNPPYDYEREANDKMLRYGQKALRGVSGALEGFGNILLVGGEMLLDISEEAIRAMREYNEADRETRNQAQKPTNTNCPKNGGNGKN